LKRAHVGELAVDQDGLLGVALGVRENVRERSRLVQRQRATEVVSRLRRSGDERGRRKEEKGR